MTCYDEGEIIARFRLSKVNARNLVELIELGIQEGDANNALSPSMQVLLTPRFLATGTFQLTLGDDVGVARTTVGRKIHKCMRAIAALRPRFIKLPEKRHEIAEAKRDFYDIAGFPGVISAFYDRHECSHPMSLWTRWRSVHKQKWVSFTERPGNL